ncbi:hypothetical protein CERSUDRAFT_116062, partial [Gelatoporia subvermispora B]
LTAAGSATRVTTRVTTRITAAWLPVRMHKTRILHRVLTIQHLRMRRGLIILIRHAHLGRAIVVAARRNAVAAQPTAHHRSCTRVVDVARALYAIVIH